MFAFPSETKQTIVAKQKLLCDSRHSDPAVWQIITRIRPSHDNFIILNWASKI